MSARKISVLTVAGDPGGAAAMSPVLRMLGTDDRMALRMLAYRQAVTLWRQQGFTVEPLDEKISTDGVSQMISTYKPSLLFTGTSVNGVDLEKTFIQAARKLAIPSLSLLDFWSNYRPRFADAAGALRYMPDKIAIMDEQARTEMSAEGFNGDRLVITGQPALDNLANCRKHFSRAQRQSLRQSLGLETDALLVMFISQPLSTFYSDPRGPQHPGYDENITLRLLLEALERLAVASGEKIHLGVRLHPREEAEKPLPMSRLIRVFKMSQGDVHHQTIASNLVIGMTSMLLVEACYLGCLTLSFQPGLRVADPLPTTRSGLTRPVYKAGELDAALKDLLLGPDGSGKMRQMTKTVSQLAATKGLVNLIQTMSGMARV